MHVLIISGGSLNIEFAKKYCETLSYDKVFAVDRGLEYIEKMQICPDVILGDFDSINANLLKKYEEKVKNGVLNSLFIRHPKKKDASDTELALRQAIEMGAKKITILAGTGSRLDHVLANLHLLYLGQKEGATCVLVDHTNRIHLLSDDTISCLEIEKKEQHGKYLSVISDSDIVEGLTIKGVQYPLDNFRMTKKNSLTVSNQIVEAYARISIQKGKIWVIESCD